MGRVLMAAAVLAAGLVALAGATGTSTFAAALFAACAVAFLAWQRLAPTPNVRVMIEAGLYGGAVLVIVTAAATSVRDNAFLLFVVWLVPWAFLAWGRGRATAYVAVLAVASAIVEWVHGEPGFSAFLRTDVPVLVVGMGGLVGVSIVVRMVVDRLADSQNATQWSAVCQACIADLARRAIEEVAADGALGREAVAMTRTVLAADRVELIAPGTPAAELPEPRDGLLLVPVGSPDGTAGHLVVVRDEHPFRRDERAFAQTVGDVLSVADRRIAAERERRELAGHDALTGLPGRERFTERLTEALSPSARADGAAVLVIDVDDFVLVNDTLGAVAGDALLCGVAGRLRRAAGESATVARLGADEFALLSPGAGRELLAVDLAKRVQTAMRVPFDVGEASQHVTVSTGIAVAARGLDAQGVLRDAHLAQRHARAQGRGRYEVFDRGLRQVLESRRTMEQELRHAIERGEFRLVYQPLVDISTGAICGAEALLRWHHPERGMVPPADFVPVAEATDLIVPIGAWALRQGLRQLKAWQDTLPGLGEFKLGINLSGRQLSDGRFVPLLRRQLAKYRIDPRRLTCELTETALTDESAQVEAAVEQIKALGVGLSLDDFGTGYASLRYVRRFAFDSLKLDRSFVAGLGVDADDTALVAAAVSMGQALNMTVVAEGVETPEQAQRLREMGCGLAQGFHFARPMEAGELRARLLGQVDAAVREPDPHPGPDSRIALQLEHAAQRFDPLARGR